MTSLVMRESKDSMSLDMILLYKLSSMMDIMDMEDRCLVNKTNLENATPYYSFFNSQT